MLQVGIALGVLFCVFLIAEWSLKVIFGPVARGGGEWKKNLEDSHLSYGSSFGIGLDR